MSVARSWAAIPKAVRQTGRLRGRATRPEFWWVALPIHSLAITLFTVGTFLFSELVETSGYYPLSDSFYFLCLPTMASVHARRFQDVGISRVFALSITAIFLAFEIWATVNPDYFLVFPEMPDPVFFVMLVGVVSLTVCLLPSQARANKWGPNPDEPTLEEMEEVFQ